ncbi:MAG: diguanylate cyclase [Pseudomonadota bacterium]
MAKRRADVSVFQTAPSDPYRAFFDRAPIPSLLLDADAVVLDANEASIGLFALERDALVGRRLHDFFPVAERRRLTRLLSRDPARVRSTPVESRLGVGQKKPILITTERLSETESLIALVDISAQKRVENRLANSRDRLARLAHEDRLTSLGNRLAFDEQLDAEMETFNRTSQSFALLYLDLDGFKEVNDKLGHQVGDRVLQIAAERLQGCVRRDDFVARLGGDEFAILLTNAGRNQIVTIAEKISRSVSDPIELNGTSVRIAASVGASVYPEHGNTAFALLAAADRAMYRAKRDDGVSLVVAPSTDKSRLSQELCLVEQLHEAVQRCQLGLYLQPQFALDDHGVSGFEAHLRWHHPVLGTLRPEAFLPMAIDPELGSRLNYWLLEHAAKHRQTSDVSDGVRLAISVSTTHAPVVDPAGFADICATLDVDPQGLDLLLDADRVLALGHSAADPLRRLRALGFGIVLDDFGLGPYAELASLAEHVSAVRLHRSIAREISSCEMQTVASTAMHLAQSLDLDVIAHSIDSQAQMDFFGAAHCHVVQGVHLGPWLPAKTAASLYEHAA